MSSTDQSSVPPPPPASTPPPPPPSSTDSSTPPPDSSTPPPPGSSTPPPPGSSTPPSSAPSSTPPSSAPGSSSAANSSAAASLTSSVLTQSSTSVFQSASVGTTNGQAFTTLVQVSTVLAPGTVITSPADHNTTSKSGSNTGAIVGGVVGGIGGLAALLALLLLYLRHRRRNNLTEFDGNFDPDRVNSGRPGGAGGGGTLPQIDLDEDDGMGGRLAGSGMGAAGLVTPFTLGGGGGAGQGQGQGQGGGEMSHIGGPLLAGAAAGAGGAYAYNHHNNENGSPTHTNTSSHYPPTTPGTQSIYSSDGYQPTMSSGQYPPNPYAPPLPLGRGPSPGPSMLAGTNSSSGHSHAGGGVGAAGAGYATSNSTSNPRSAKELEAFGAGRRVVNPDEGGGPSASAGGQGEEHLPNPYTSVDPQAHAAYLQSGPGRRESVGPAFPLPQHHQQPHFPYVQPAAQGSGVIVHQDGGRIPDRAEEGREEQAEIPPTYDSIPREER